MTLPQPHVQMQEIEVGRVSRLLYIAGVCFGSVLSSFTREIAVRQTSHGFSCSPNELFNRPWMMSILMAIGMALSLALFRVRRYFKADDLPDFKFTTLSFKYQILILFATLCDIYFSVQATVAAIYVGSGVAVALRFCDIIFISFLNRFVRKRMFMKYTIISVVLMISGLGLVGLAEMLDSPGQRSYWWAVILHLTAQFMSSLKSIIEEEILHGTDIPPMCLCGMEGIIQLVVIFTMIYPIVYVISSNFAGFHEDFCDSFLMLFHNGVLTSIFFVYPCIACFFNFSVVGVIQRRSGATFVVLEMANSAVVWVINLIIYHGFDGNIGVAKGMGVSWRKFSPMRLLGTIVVIFGCLMYIRAIEFPCLEYEEAQVTTIKVPKEESAVSDGLDM